MYAVIESGGKQYRVAIGDRLKVESLVAESGSTVEIERVLVVADSDDIRIGTPHLSGATVTARVVGHGRSEKIRVFKMKRRKNYRRTYGHRQGFTELEITEIAGAGRPGQQQKESVMKAVTDAPTTEGDDLTQINGIGPKISEKLYDLGITTLAQIAAFNQEDMDRVNEQLSFKGRIERENWVEQARALVGDVGN